MVEYTNLIEHQTLRIDKDESVEVICVGTQPSHLRLDIQLVGDGASVKVYGAFVGFEIEKIMMDIYIHHEADNCSSEQMIRALGDDVSNIHVSSNVYVHENTVGNEASQDIKSILVSERARVSMRPQLFIETDDVKCSHGATVGQLDEDAIYYMMTRGLTRQDAQAKLVGAFFWPFNDNVAVQSKLIGMRYA